MIKKLSLLSLILLFGCQGVEPINKPENLIPLDSLEQIIYDLSIVNAARGYNIQRFAQTGVKPESYIYEKYNIDSTRFTNSTIYYAADVEAYSEFIDKIRIRVEKEYKVADSLEKIDKKIKDSLRFAKAKKRKNVRDSVSERFKKNIEIPPTRIPQLDSMIQ